MVFKAIAPCFGIINTMIQRPSYVAYINLILLIFLLISVHLMVFVFAPALRFSQSRTNADLERIGLSFDLCTAVDEYSIDQIYHLFECQRSNRFELIVISELGNIIARTSLGTNTYEMYVQENFSHHQVSETVHITRIFLNDAWVWIVREAQREMRYDDNMNRIWEVNFAWSN
jgi:hypothetical protein